MTLRWLLGLVPGLLALPLVAAAAQHLPVLVAGPEQPVGAADGLVVRCVRAACTHDHPPVTARVDGLTVTSRVEVFRAGGGWGVSARISVMNTDHHAHRLSDDLHLSGSTEPLSPPPNGGISGFGQISYSSHVPVLRPGQTRVLRTTFPNMGRTTDAAQPLVLPGERLVLRVRLGQHRLPVSGSTTTPRVLEVILTAPRHGSPRLRLRPGR